MKALKLLAWPAMPAKVAGLALYALAPDVVAPKAPQSAVKDVEALLQAQEALPGADDGVAPVAPVAQGPIPSLQGAGGGGKLVARGIW